eukprot:5154953-Alexandrium_andersonii.AAC.1
MRNSSAASSSRRRTRHACQCRPRSCFPGDRYGGGASAPCPLAWRRSVGRRGGPLAQLPRPA